MKPTTRFASLAALLVSASFPLFASAAGSITITLGGGGGGVGCGQGDICGVASTILFIINNVLVPLLFSIAFIVFLYGVFKTYILSHGDAGAVEEGHKLILWGIIGFVVMISLWGLVNVVSNTFGLSGYNAPTLPTSY